ncbi:unnamed protein product [Cuscuta campestris]|uniref:40S ribosomal protein S29 n=1 Tax=Cuscuta campestris TaxID=132261 RepID=A0A484LXS4_9ASTE|nr:unnamed protein product [Cuscuta campestris]
MGHSNIWNAHPKNYGPGSRACRVCGNPHAIIRKYGIMCCRVFPQQCQGDWIHQVPLEDIGTRYGVIENKI